MTPQKTATAPVQFEIGGDEQFRSPDFQARLVGVVYDVYVPKATASLEFARTVQKFDVKPSKKAKGKGVSGPSDIDNELEAIEAILDWTDQVFGDKGEEIRVRVKDPKDRLDSGHLAEFMQKVVEVARENSEDPTT